MHLQHFRSLHLQHTASLSQHFTFWQHSVTVCLHFTPSPALQRFSSQLQHLNSHLLHFTAHLHSFSSHLHLQHFRSLHLQHTTSSSQQYFTLWQHSSCCCWQQLLVSALKLVHGFSRLPFWPSSFSCSSLILFSNSVILLGHSSTICQ